MNKHGTRPTPLRLICVWTVTCALLSCGLTVLASEPTSQTEPPSAITIFLPPAPEAALYPVEVQTIADETAPQVIKTYVLTEEESTQIPRESFERGGFLYELTDITQTKTSSTDIRAHVEMVERNTSSKDLNEILQLFASTMEYQSEDGYSGVLTLDLASVKCEAAGYKNSSYTVTATREYPHLSTNDLSLIPKTITDNGRTLALDGVSWEAQQTVNVDYQDIPTSYRAVASYTTKASKSTVTGYVTTAEYTGEIRKSVTGDTIYTAYFSGTEINPMKDTEAFEPTLPLLIGIALLAALLAGGGMFLLLRHNVRVYAIGDKGRVLVAKVRISAKNPTIDLTPLRDRMDSDCFSLEIDPFTANLMNGTTIDIIFGPKRMQHRIAYEGNLYRLEADFNAMAVRVLY